MSQGKPSRPASPPAPPVAPACSKCKAWRGQPGIDAEGECHADPPTPVYMTFPNRPPAVVSRWPVVKADGECERFRARGPA